MDVVMMDGSADKPEGGRGPSESHDAKRGGKKGQNQKGGGQKAGKSDDAGKPSGKSAKPGKSAGSGKKPGKAAPAKPAKEMSLRQQVASGLVTAPTTGKQPKEVRVSGRRRSAKKPKP